MTIDIEKIVIKVKLTEGKMKAIVALDFGEVVLRGFRILDSQFENDKGEKLWITPPVYPGGGKYHPIVFFPNKQLWEQISARILAAYQEANKNRYKKTFDLSDEEADAYFK